ncbi:hypothetical protein J0X12_01285 [Sneathiella sp. CAU 1612]|uniref:Uncharacterized protein n=1 Tax=Sneathiella sedimenti TaxID=2816034 RepID=A0ABS3F138_9PROT|nr:hypothetical protein [Sneathiella sedimenti]MBO0332227.1 hypothetical protein [Sneathiella sedimenti]
MKSWIKTLSGAAAGILLCASTIEAASLHGDYGQGQGQSRAEWFSELQQQQNTDSPVAFASEKFRNIPLGKSVSLTFEEEKDDSLKLFSTSSIGASDRLQNKWLELLFGVYSLDVEEDGSYVPISSQSTSAIPLPAGFFLFFGGLAGLLLLGWLRKRT